MSSVVGCPRGGGSPDNPSATEGETGKPGPSPAVADARWRPRITDEEWAEFVGHFERRKVALGDCGRSYSTPCIHEHSCLRCPLLRPDPAQRTRLIEIRDNLTDRITEADRERWLGEAEGLKISLAGANIKLAQMDMQTNRRNATVGLGIPTFGETAGRTTSPDDQPIT